MQVLHQTPVNLWPKGPEMSRVAAELRYGGCSLPDRFKLLYSKISKHGHGVGFVCATILCKAGPYGGEHLCSCQRPSSMHSILVGLDEVRLDFR